MAVEGAAATNDTGAVAPTVTTDQATKPDFKEAAKDWRAERNARIARTASTLASPAPQAERAAGKDTAAQAVTQAAATEPAEPIAEPVTEPAGDPDPGEVVFTDDTGNPVSRDEARKGYLRQADYSRKTAEVATRGTRLGETQALVDQAANLAAALMPTFVQLQQGNLPAIPPEPHAGLKQTDPMAFWDQWNTRQAAIQEFNGRLYQAQQLTATQQQIQARAAQEATAAEETALLDKLPAWKNPATRSKDIGDIVAYVRKLGHPTVTAKDLEGASHYLLLALRDAELGARVRAGGAKGTKPGQAGAGIGTPATRPAGTLTGPVVAQSREDARARLRPGGGLSRAARMDLAASLLRR